jgi:hypothetical protein
MFFYVGLGNKSVKYIPSFEIVSKHCLQDPYCLGRCKEGAHHRHSGQDQGALAGLHPILKVVKDRIVEADVVVAGQLELFIRVARHVEHGVEGVNVNDRGAVLAQDVRSFRGHEGLKALACRGVGQWTREVHSSRVFTILTFGMLPILLMFLCSSFLTNPSCPGRGNINNVIIVAWRIISLS